MLQVIHGIQTGPYKNIYNPENFHVPKHGSGAGNNWAAGYAAGDSVYEEVMEMIEREADGSDSLEVHKPGKNLARAPLLHGPKLIRVGKLSGIHVTTLNRRRYGVRTWVVLAGKAE